MSSVNSSHSFVHNFFFHPLHNRGQKTKTALAIITNIFLTTVTGGLWQIPFWIVNRLDHKKAKVLKGNTSGVSNASSRVFAGASRPKGNVTGSAGTASVGDVTASVPPDVSQIAFGRAYWEKYFGKVGKLPKLPRNINEILAADCKIFPGNPVWKTHILVLVPEKVNNQPLTLQSLGELVKMPKEPKDGSMAHKSQYEDFSKGIPEKCKTQSLASHWVLITKDVIGGIDKENGTRGKSYSEQERMVKEIAIDPDTGKPIYTVPSVRDMVISIFMHHVTTGERLFSDSPLTFTRCLDEDSDRNRISVGAHSVRGLSVQGFSFDGSGSSFGMAASRLF